MIAQTALLTLASATLLGAQRQAPVQAPVAVNHDASATTRATNEVLARTVTLTLDRVSLKRAVDSVARSAQVLVQYEMSLFDAYQKPVTITFTHVTVGVALERLLDGTALRVVPDGLGALAIRSVAANDSTPRTGAITGRVIDSATGRAIIGAAVKVAGTKIGGTTVDSGRFVLRGVPAGEYVVMVKEFGYRPAERTVTVSAGEHATVRFALASAPNVLSGVVTTATGTVDRRKIGNDITVINADSIMKVAPIRNVTDLLDTRVPGLTVQHTSGVPGAPARLRLRGIGGGLVPGATNISNDPVVYVDGVQIYARQSTQRDQNAAAGGYAAPTGIDDIDPNTIDKIEVFKGPSASSHFGPDAANGVIWITTKKGRSGPPRVAAALSTGVNYLPGQYAGPGFYRFGHQLGDPATTVLCGGIGQPQGAFVCIQDSTKLFQALTVPRLSMTTIGTTNGATLSASGGATALTYWLGSSVTQTLGYLKMPGLYRDQYRQLNGAPAPDWMVRPDRYRTWSGNGKFTTALYPGFELTFNTSLANGDQQQSSAQGQLAALSSVYIDTTVFDTARLNDYALRVTDHGVTANNSLFASITRWSWLPTTATIGVSTDDRQDVGQLERGVNVSKGKYSYARNTSQIVTLNVNGTLFRDRKVPIMLGVNTTKTTTRDFQGSVDSLGAGVGVPSSFTVSGQNTTALMTGGWFISPQLNLGNRFFSSPGFRIDQSGVSGANGASQKYGGLTSILPKIDFSWVAIDRHDQRPLFGMITALRPRIVVGASELPPDPDQLYRVYQAASAYDTTRQANGSYTSVPYSGVRLVTVGNPLLKPERSRELEGGGDLELWGNRFSLRATHFRRLRLDAIVQTPVAPSAGGSNLLQYRNLGKIRNTGTEWEMEAALVSNSATTWTVGGSYASDKNMVVSLNDGGSVIDFGNGNRVVKGYPLGATWDRPIVGYITPPAGQKLGLRSVVIGDSVEYLGKSQPDYTGRMSSNVTLFHGVLGINVGFKYEYGLTQSATGSAQLLTNLYQDSSASLGQQAAAIAAWCSVYGHQDNYVGSFTSTDCRDAGTLAGVVQDVNVIRFNDFSVNYNVPMTVSRRFRLPPVQILLQGYNLALWTSYRGKDPDVNGTPVGEALRDDGQLPEPRTWTLRIQLN